MTYIRKYNIALVAAFLCVVLVFAFAYNMSVKQMLTGTIEENREFLRNLNNDIVYALTETESTAQWEEIINRTDDLSISIEDSNNKVIALSRNTDASAMDISVQTAFEYKGEAYLINSRVFFLYKFSPGSESLLSYLIIEFLIGFFAVVLIGFTVYTVLLRPYRAFYYAVEEYEKTGNFKKNKFGGYIGKVYNRFAELTERLDRQQQNQNRIIASISHDIKTPLTSIMGYSERLEKDSLPEERKKRYVKTIHSKAEEIRELVDEFDEYLNYNLLKELKATKVSSSYILGVIKDEFADELMSYGISLEISDFTSGENTLIDIQKMKRVFGNIISNSVKHFEEGKAKIIKIEAFSEREKIIFKVSDSGKGLRMENYNIIFEPFYTSDKGRKVAGLGLPICKEIIERHGGKIYAEKSSLGGLSIVIELYKFSEL